MSASWIVEFEILGFFELIENGEKEIVFGRKEGNNIIGILIAIINGDKALFFRPEIGDEVVILNITDFDGNGYSELQIFNEVTSEMEIYSW